MSWNVLDNRATRARENGRGYVSLNENVAVFILVAALAARAGYLAVVSASTGPVSAIHRGAGIRTGE